ncbi:MAG: hypothetical protein HGJ94_12875 [Desulfosarcina sp.]|nr:hypothetical protein [Desulfosarcina sp.]MBC2743274.1 hypothetical protein [Desulfosarcina sp.]MBC2766184.1 hypothetical protein [Desulfosarcina sp.]
MTAITLLKKNALPLLLVALLVSGCGIASSYRPAGKKTIRDFSGSSDYRKAVGVLALSNTTIFTSAQLTSPFMTAFLSSMESAVSNAVLVVPGKAEAPPFLWNPPRIANGNMDVFTLSGLARQEGMNAVVSPVLMDIRVRARDTGFWVFKDVAYSLQIQTAAAVYDAATGARLALGILTDEVDIDEHEAGIVRNGQEVQVDELVEVAEEMGEELGEQMGDAVKDSKWLAAVVSIEDGACVITAGSEVGIKAGDRFTVLDGSGVLTGLGGQRYIVPGPKIGEITISRAAARQSFGAPESGELPPAGSILIPGR